MKYLSFLLAVFVAHSVVAQRGSLSLSAGPAFGREADNSGMYLLSVGPVLGKHIGIRPSVGYIKFREHVNGFVPIGGDVTIHSFHSKKKIIPYFAFGAYYPLYTGKNYSWGTHGEFMGRLGMGAMTPITKNTRLGLSGSFMPFFFTPEDGVYNDNSLTLRNLFSVSVEVMFVKSK